MSTKFPLRCPFALFHLLCLLLCTFALPAAEAPNLTNAIAQARALIQKELAPKVPGVSVAVAIDGKIVWSEGFGYMDLEAKKPVTTETKFRIGSISKSLTSVGLALMVERGQIDLDAPIQKYVPDFPDKGAPITTRMLGGHLSGIRHYAGFENRRNQAYANSHAALTIFQNDPLVAPPGTKYNYTTYGWTLISAAMDSALQQDFISHMDKNVLQPLNLKHTRADQKGITDPHCTKFYSDNLLGKLTTAPEVDSSYKWAGGGYLSTPEDLVRLGSALLQPGFLKASSLKLLFTPQKTSDGKPTNYGLGWFIGKDAQGHRILWHTGGSTGGKSVLLLHPETKTVFALVSNHSTPTLPKKDWETITELFAPFYTAAKSSTTNATAITKGRQFLVNLMDEELGLLPEFRTAKVYWLYHDNYLAAKVLNTSHPAIAKRLRDSITREGATKSGKIEILFGESAQPLPFRQYELTDVRRAGDKLIRTEIVTPTLMKGWEQYADLLLFASLAETDRTIARQHYDAALRLWDGTGFLDPAAKTSHRYATYKLALALIARNRFTPTPELPAGLIERLRSMQADTGGWITDYDATGKPLGFANVETTSLCLLALEAQSTQ
ncbi:MAG TPA: serine hydrolase domain-containing protein [Verrucomicrobiae bacterium]